MTTTVIISGKRTPMGKFMGGLSTLSAVELGALAARAAIAASGIAASDIDYSIVGQVLTAGAGQLAARQTAIAAGVPWDKPALSINKVCLSGISAIALADQLIRAGEVDTVLAVGQESMSNAPFVLPGARKGYGYGDASLIDAIYYDGLRDVYTQESMGTLTDSVNEKYGFSRQEQDEFTVSSHELAYKAWQDGVFADEVIPVSIAQRKGDPLIVSQDEGIRHPISVGDLAKLKPVFSPTGTITAANASPLSDGGAAVIVMRKDKAQEMGLSWLAEIVAHGMYAGPDSSLQLQPAKSLAVAARKANIAISDLDLIEINEAFAAVGLASIKDLGVDPGKINIHGGALAIGHPLGMSGARVVLHIANELAKAGDGLGGACLCGGGGQGDALILKA